MAISEQTAKAATVKQQRGIEISFNMGGHGLSYDAEHYSELISYSCQSGGESWTGWLFTQDASDGIFKLFQEA